MAEMLDPSLVAAYLAAAGWAADLIADPGTTSKWSEASALEGYSVGGLASHLVQAGVTRLWQVLGRSEPTGLAMVGLTTFYGINRIESPDERAWDLHAVLIGMGEEQAANGPGALRRAMVERLGFLEEVLPGSPAERVVPVLSVEGGGVDLGTFLRTRVVELVVHGDDLMASVGGRPVPVPPDAAGIAIGALVDMARDRHGDTRVIRALARRERSDPQAPLAF